MGCDFEIWLIVCGWRLLYLRVRVYEETVDVFVGGLLREAVWVCKVDVHLDHNSKGGVSRDLRSGTPGHRARGLLAWAVALVEQRGSHSVGALRVCWPLMGRSWVARSACVAPTERPVSFSEMKLRGTAIGRVTGRHVPDTGSAG